MQACIEPRPRQCREYEARVTKCVAAEHVGNCCGDDAGGTGIENEFRERHVKGAFVCVLGLGKTGGTVQTDPNILRIVAEKPVHAIGGTRPTRKVDS